MRELLLRQADILSALSKITDYKANEQESRFLWRAFEDVLLRQGNSDLVEEQKRLCALQKQEPLGNKERQEFHVEAQRILCLQQMTLQKLAAVPKNAKPLASHISRLGLLAQFNNEFKAPARLSARSAGIVPTKIKSIDALLTWLFQFANPHAPLYVSAAKSTDERALSLKFSISAIEPVELIALRLWFKAVIICLSAVPDMPAFTCSDPELIDQCPIDWVEFKNEGLKIRLDAPHLCAIEEDLADMGNLRGAVMDDKKLRAFPWQETGIRSNQITPLYRQQLKEAFGLADVASVQGCVQIDKARAGLWLCLPQAHSSTLFAAAKQKWQFYSYLTCVEKLGNVFGFDVITDCEHVPNHLPDIMTALLELQSAVPEPSVEHALGPSL